jgi:hypothetical protein
MVAAVGGAAVSVAWAFGVSSTTTTGCGASVGGVAGSSVVVGGTTVVTSTGISHGSVVGSGWQLTPTNVKQNAQNKTNPGRFLSIGISLSIVSRYYTGMG